MITNYEGSDAPHHPDPRETWQPEKDSIHFDVVLLRNSTLHGAFSFMIVATSDSENSSLKLFYVAFFPETTYKELKTRSHTISSPASLQRLQNYGGQLAELKTLACLLLSCSSL